MPDIPLNNKIDDIELSKEAKRAKFRKANTKNDNDMNWLINRLQERSTWRGIIAALTGLGVITLGEELRTAIIAAGISVFALIEILVKDSDSPDK